MTKQIRVEEFKKWLGTERKNFLNKSKSESAQVCVFVFVCVCVCVCTDTAHAHYYIMGGASWKASDLLNFIKCILPSQLGL